MENSINREKVIRHIAAEIEIARVCKKDFALVDIDMLSDALSLLKEQEEEIESLKQTAQSMMEGVCLLKEQEAVEPKVIRMNEFGHPVHACGNCGNSITESMNYCPSCGQAVKWNA